MEEGRDRCLVVWKGRMVEVELEISGGCSRQAVGFGGGALKLEAPNQKQVIRMMGALCTRYD